MANIWVVILIIYMLGEKFVGHVCTEKFLNEKYSE